MKKFDPKEHKNQGQDRQINADDILKFVLIVIAVIFLKFFGMFLYWFIYAWSPWAFWVGIVAIPLALILIRLNGRK